MHTTHSIAGVVMGDADLNSAITECVAGSLSYNGQRCTALKLLFVHESIVDKFIASFCEKVCLYYYTTIIYYCTILYYTALYHAIPYST